MPLKHPEAALMLLFLAVYCSNQFLLSYTFWAVTFHYQDKADRKLYFNTETAVYVTVSRKSGIILALVIIYEPIW